MAKKLGELTARESNLIERARNGDWDAFTSHFLRLPFSGTWYTPEDRVATYSILHKIWKASGSPEEGEIEFTIPAGLRAYKVFLGEYEDEPAFLEPHGYILLDWYRQLKERNPDVMVVVGGTGSAKTSSVGADVLMQMALEPGFDFLNLAPTARQSLDMLRDVTKWVDTSRYGDFVVRPRTGGLFKDVLGVKVLTVNFGMGAYSTFRCMTLGEQQGDFVLGDEADRINVDEAGLLANIDSYIARLITRIRGTRRNGMPRYSRPALGFLSNPHNNPSMDRLVDRAEEQMAERTEDIGFVFGSPTTDDNIYTTEKQKRLQRALLSAADQARWMGGSRAVFAGLGIITTVMIETCHDKTMDEDLKYWQRRGAPYEEMDRIGLVHYRLPREKGHEYIIAGDPGTQPLHSIQDNNVPAVIVLDVTDFPDKQATLVAYRIFGGEGRWETWVNQMKEWANYYQITGGAYDATSAQSILGEFPLSKYPHILSVTFAGAQKAIAKTFFQLMAGQGFFRWPFILRLWTEAKEYREVGRGVKKLPDDTLSALFAASWYMRWRYYNELPDKLQMEKKTDEQRVDDIAKMQAIINRRSRYARNARVRYRRIGEKKLPGPPL